MLKLFACRLETNFRKQFASRLTLQINAQTVCLPTGDEFSRTVCLAKDPAILCSNCLLADWWRIFANSLSREGPHNSILKLFAGRPASNFRSLCPGGPRNSLLKLFADRLAINFREQIVSWRTRQFFAQTVFWPTGDEFSQTVCLARDPAIVLNFLTYHVVFCCEDSLASARLKLTRLVDGRSVVQY